MMMRTVPRTDSGLRDERPATARTRSRADAWRQPGTLYGLLDQLPVGTLIVDRAHSVTYLSARARELLGLDERDWTGCPVAAMLRREARSAPDNANVRGDGVFPSVLGMPDGRLVRCTTRDLPEGWLVTVEADVAAAGLAADPLGTSSHRLLVAQLQDELKQGHHVTLFRLDVGRIKEISDTIGRDVADAVLRIIAGRLVSVCGPEDSFFTLCGESFAIVRRGPMSRDEAGDFAECLIELAGRPCLTQGQIATVGLDVGIAFAPADAAQGDTLLRSAELALHNARAGGGSSCRMFDPIMNERMIARRTLEFDLRKAVTYGEFELFYQPQADLETGRLVGFEALIRWPHAQRGNVPPLDFIPLAEELGLIGALGEWVLRTACRQAAGWPDATTIAVNVSPEQFRGDRLIEMVSAALADSGLAPQRLELEITESVLLSNSEANLATLRRLRDLGVRIALDDFGTGYSSLSYLSSFPFDKIKIDKSFVQQMRDSRSCDAIVRAVAGLGRSLEIDTIAEGVETDDQLAAVRASGFRSMQGYLFGRPLPAAQIDERLAASTLSLGASHTLAPRNMQP